MALDNYAGLKAAVLDWMARSDLSGNVADWVTLAEARINRELNPVEVDQTLNGATGSRTISTAAWQVVEPLALYLIDTNSSSEIELLEQSDFTRIDANGRPRFWDFRPGTSSEIVFECPLDADYTFRFRYRQRFALSDSAPTNWLLTNHPDVYLAAAIVWGGGFTANYEQAAAFKLLLEEALPGIRNTIAQSKRARLTVDPALSARRYRTRNGYYDY